MTAQAPQIAHGRRQNKSVFRNTTRCLKLTAEEARRLDEIAKAEGVPRSEWMRNAILRELRADRFTDPLLGEMIGVRLLLVNVLRPFASGQRVTPEVFDRLLDDIGTAKHDLAAKLLADARR